MFGGPHIAAWLLLASESKWALPCPHLDHHFSHTYIYIYICIDKYTYIYIIYISIQIQVQIQYATLLYHTIQYIIYLDPPFLPIKSVLYMFYSMSCFGFLSSFTIFLGGTFWGSYVGWSRYTDEFAMDGMLATIPNSSSISFGCGAGKSV